MLPSRIPNLLINGATGIAVGMATNIPPHNLNEVCTALIKLLDNPELTQRAAVPLHQGAGLSDRRRDAELARGAEGDLQDRLGRDPPARAPGRWARRRATAKTIYITSVPYTVNKSTLVERIADVALSRKLPPLVDVKDLSTDDVRIALELKKDADEKMVMAYLFKHTPLQTNFLVNLTCLIPTENPEVGRPERLDLHAMLWHFLHFRLDVVTQAAGARARGAEEARSTSSRASRRSSTRSTRSCKIVRKSEGKADAAQQIIKRFELDAEQTDAILELKIYRLARLEILVIRKELEEKRRRARQIGGAAQGRREPLGHRPRSRSRRSRRSTATRGGRRSRATPARRSTPPRTSSSRKTTSCIVSRDGWVKRQKEVKDVADDAAARGRRGAGGAAGQHARDGRVLQQLRRRLHRADRRRAGVDRLRRADPALLQAEGRRADRRGAEPRPARRRARSRRRRKARSRRSTPSP